MKASEKQYKLIKRIIVESGVDKIPPILYQYADISSLRGIIKNDVLWATHFRYLNDRKEFDYGLSLAQNYAREHKKSFKSKHTHYFLDIFLNIFQECAEQGVLPFPKVDIYSVSLTSKRDLLSQWRGYGKKYKSVCIGFDSKSLVNNVTNGRSGYILRKIVYDPKTQQDLVYDFMRKSCMLFEQNPQDFEKDWNYREKKVRLLVIGFVILILSFKESCWKEEDEWRIITLPYESVNGTQYDIFFREKDFGLVPYIKLPIFFKNSIDSIQEILLPNSDHYLLNKKSMEMFLRKYVCKKTGDESCFKIRIEQSEISIVY